MTCGDWKATSISGSGANVAWYISIPSNTILRVKVKTKFEVAPTTLGIIFCQKIIFCKNESL